MRLSDFSTLTFDCYGTLIDWETGMITALAPLVERVQRPVSRDEILAAHARHESAQQLQTPTRLYRDVLAIVYKRLGEEWGVPPSWDECIAYGRSIGDWPAFADTVEALDALDTGTAWSDEHGGTLLIKLTPQRSSARFTRSRGR